MGADPGQEKDWAQQCQESSEEFSGVLGSSGLLERGQSLSCIHSKLNPVYVTGYMRTRPFPQAIAGHFYRKLVRVYSCLWQVGLLSFRIISEFR